MSTIEVEGRHVELNNKGYLVNFEDWDKDVAETMAKIDHLSLSKCHWIAIDFMRDFYREYEIPPSPRALLIAVGDLIHEHGCTRKDLNEIFPKGGCKHACRIAGLPDAYCHSC
jgi:tRNA 2-thiouridine synthesizing protein E